MKLSSEEILLNMQLMRTNLVPMHSRCHADSEYFSQCGVNRQETEFFGNKRTYTQLYILVQIYLFKLFFVVAQSIFSKFLRNSLCYFLQRDSENILFDNFFGIWTSHSFRSKSVVISELGVGYRKSTYRRLIAKFAGV